MPKFEMGQKAVLLVDGYSVPFVGELHAGDTVLVGQTLPSGRVGCSVYWRTWLVETFVSPKDIMLEPEYRAKEVLGTL